MAFGLEKVKERIFYQVQNPRRNEEFEAAMVRNTTSHISFQGVHLRKVGFDSKYSKDTYGNGRTSLSRRFGESFLLGRV